MPKNIWKDASIKITRNSGFDKSFHSLGTPTVGTITPLLFDEVIPSSKTKIDCALAINLPPLAFDTFMRLSFDLEAIFVPTRILMENYQYYFAQEQLRVYGGPNVDVCPPAMQFLNPLEQDSNAADVYTSAQKTVIRQFHAMFGVNSLADYLGLRQSQNWFELAGYPATTGFAGQTISLLPFLAYHRAWQDLYRNQKVQNPCFFPRSNSSPATSVAGRLANSPFFTFDSTSFLIVENPTKSVNDSFFNLADGVSLFSFRQRNWDFDPYTTAYTTPNVTSPEGIQVGSVVQGQITIPQIRIANKSQEFRDRNALVGANFVDQLNVRYGANLSNSIAQRAICIGSASLPIYTSSVLQQAMDQAQSVGTNNPFSSVGAKYGQAYTDAKSFLCDFEAQEPGYLFVMGTLTPSACYANGVARHFRRYIGPTSIVDMANGLLEQVGPEAIPADEIMATYGNPAPVPTFGYQDRYYSFKSRVDEVHGFFRAGNSLGSAVAQRVLTHTPQMGSLNSDFLEIKTTALDNVTAVTADVSQYGCQVDAYFRYFQTMPLHDFILPSITDPAYEHGKPVHFKRGGYEIR